MASAGKMPTSDQAGGMKEEDQTNSDALGKPPAMARNCSALPARATEAGTAHTSALVVVVVEERPGTPASALAVAAPAGTRSVM